MRFIALALVAFVFSTTVSCAEIQQYLQGEGEGMTAERVAAGLKEALEVGTQRTVNQTSVRDGFLANALIRITMPSELQRMMNTLRDIGLDRQVDDLEVKMNRAAEAAAGEAFDVFVNVIRGMTIQDAWSILNGDQHAATDYFRARTTAELTSRFQPIVQDKMQEVGLYNAYTFLNDAYARLPFTSSQGFDLEAYVVDRALNGLFVTLEDEEERIRENVSARSTQLLRDVFGYRDAQRAAQ